MFTIIGGEWVVEKILDKVWEYITRTPLDKMKKDAEKGNAEAQYALALMYYSGEKVPYLGVDVSGCKKSEIVQRLIESILPGINQTLPAEILTSPPELPVVIHETVKPESRSPGIFLRLLKYALCCVIGLFAILLLTPALKGDKAGMCFPVAFAIAGTLTAITARRKGEDSAFKWWLYGALVPIVSWIDVAMLGAENKAKAFMRGLAYILVGFAVFVIVFVNFLP